MVDFSPTSPSWPFWFLDTNFLMGFLKMFKHLPQISVFGIHLNLWLLAIYVPLTLSLPTRLRTVSQRGWAPVPCQELDRMTHVIASLCPHGDCAVQMLSFYFIYRGTGRPSRGNMLKIIKALNVQAVSWLQTPYPANNALCLLLCPLWPSLLQFFVVENALIFLPALTFVNISFLLLLMIFIPLFITCCHPLKYLITLPPPYLIHHMADQAK